MVKKSFVNFCRVQIYNFDILDLPTAPVTPGQGMAPATQRQNATRGVAQTAGHAPLDLESAASVCINSCF